MEEAYRGRIVDGKTGKQIGEECRRAIQALYATKKRAEQEVRRAQKKVEDTLALMSRRNCPFSIGDVLQRKDLSGSKYLVCEFLPVLIQKRHLVWCIKARKVEGKRFLKESIEIHGKKGVEDWIRCETWARNGNTYVRP